ncbi:phosphatase PAP2 family protein [Raineyella fluvialis]|uniref:Phosphatase PAP2 family protein n=1 Tax=Raineyella fluvialis TaxID=2662261 RepID=A0A5Q2FF71_9ACTN|nr:phosphatase PAP2 family protein [Raineyella fluvialis]QGF22926.1 phosphatase PAP2 family protein [Raineyella fluvialis]
MSEPLPHRVRLWLPPTALLVYVVWTLLAVSGLLGPFDRLLLLDPPLDRAHGAFQLLAAVGIVGAPVVLYTGLVLLAYWAYRRRLRELALAIVLAGALSWAGITLAKIVLRMPRPPYSPDILAVSGWGYPSGHLSAIVTVAVMVTATMMTTRQSHATTRGWRVGGVALVLLYAIDRWGLGAHWFSDIVGGALWGRSRPAGHSCSPRCTSTANPPPAPSIPPRTRSRSRPAPR